MGIRGLLGKLHSITVRKHLSAYAGKRAGIDGNGWLHKGAYGCAMALAQQHETDAYVLYFMDRIRLLQQYQIDPIVILDGNALPAKAETNASRQLMRKTCHENGMEMIKEGKEREAFLHFSKGTTVTQAMKTKLILALKKAEIPYVVSPYEGDAQLAYMAREKMIDVVISDDSDCLPYGIRTILFKLDMDGSVEEIKRKNLGANQALRFVDWNDDMFLLLCVLTGCDYCPALPGIGLMTACKLVSKYPNLKQLLGYLEAEHRQGMAEQYSVKFIQALLTFRHQRVFDLNAKALIFLQPLENSSQLIALLPNPTDLDFLGPSFSDRNASEIAMGRMDAITKDIVSVVIEYSSESTMASSNTVTVVENNTMLPSPMYPPPKKVNPFSLNLNMQEDVFYEAPKKCSEPILQNNVPSPSWSADMESEEDQDHYTPARRFHNIPMSPFSSSTSQLTSTSTAPPSEYYDDKENDMLLSQEDSPYSQPFHNHYPEKNMNVFASQKVMYDEVADLQHPTSVQNENGNGITQNVQIYAPYHRSGFTSPMVSEHYRALLPSLSTTSEPETIEFSKFENMPARNVTKDTLAPIRQQIGISSKRVRSNVARPMQAFKRPCVTSNGSTSAGSTSTGATTRPPPAKTGPDNRFAELVRQHALSNPNAANVSNFSAHWGPQHRKNM